MTHNDHRWSVRVKRLAPWLWRAAYDGNKIRSRSALHAYFGLMQAHRWLWVRGMEL